MISTGDTASVLKQRTSRSASPLRPSVAAHPTFAFATACAHGPKG